jgi:hypothetical protein
MNAKKRKQLKSQLRELTTAQLVALATQKTETPYKELLSLDPESLIDLLVEVEGVLKPEAVS